MKLTIKCNLALYSQFLFPDNISSSLQHINFTELIETVAVSATEVGIKQRKEIASSLSKK